MSRRGKKRKSSRAYVKAPGAHPVQTSENPKPTIEGTPPSHSKTKQSQAQRRAIHALACIKSLPNDAGNYVSYVKAVPANILMSGLGQAVAMEKAGHKDKGHLLLYQNLDAWLCNRNNEGWEKSPYDGQADLIEAIINGSQDIYVKAQAEALEYLDWLKKFAVAYLAESEATDE